MSLENNNKRRASTPAGDASSLNALLDVTEETNEDLVRLLPRSSQNGNDNRHNQSDLSTAPDNSTSPSDQTKKILGVLVVVVFLLLLLDATFSPKEQRIIGPDATTAFLSWIKSNPKRGSCAYVIVHALTTVVLVPATPLTMGSGYVFVAGYGWAGGITLATASSMLGSILGSSSCFVIGRYLMRDSVRKWSRRYPLFDAIDVAVSDNGFRIMAMLYQTPILPLAPISYMCGTSSMPLHSFALARLASTPLMLLQVFVGASTGTIVSGEAERMATPNGAVGSFSGDGDNSQTRLMIFGIILSVVSISCVSRVVKKELYKIFEQQKQSGGKPHSSLVESPTIEIRTTRSQTRSYSVDDVSELGLHYGLTRHRRPRTPIFFETQEKGEIEEATSF